MILEFYKIIQIKSLNINLKGDATLIAFILMYSKYKKALH